MRRGRERRLSGLQRVILEELAAYRDTKVASPEALSLLVAKRYCPSKVWSLEETKRRHPEAYPLAKALHRKTEMVRNEFSASFSRSLRNLEKKGLIQLVRGKHEMRYEDGKHVYYRLIRDQPRVSFVVHHQSPYFGNPNPDIQFIEDIVKSIWEKKSPS